MLIIARNGAKKFFQSARQPNLILGAQLLDEPENHSFSLGENAMAGARSCGR
ncbi:hypothetical protein [Bosea psychrotolerans]|uniref:hypothetical protein n=1 Tax=Bosea psychrotolerans TaxID=1871628 RepID=UPI001FEBD886|nr:hypothetical protein [Bosea psychrotolerans]